MAGTVYALLVGINDYGGKPSSLHGCVADVEALEALIRARVDANDLHIELLRDREATRQQIIDRFEGHLGQAGPGDVALFAFSGHGSTETVEDRFWFLEPTGKNQTIVCVDSRSKRAGDLADKELNELIQHISARGPHVVVILDCCHSGGGTREPDVITRLAQPADQPRPLESYLPGVRAAAEAARAVATAAPGGGAAATPAGLAHPRHVALLACGPTQLAKEISVNGGARGVFSLALEQALTTMPDTATYRQLIGAANHGVRNRVLDQDPVVFVEGEESDQPFLGGAVVPRPATITLQREGTEWCIDVGRVHGIEGPQDATTTVLSVIGLAGAAAPDHPLGLVRVTHAGATRSTVDVSSVVLDDGSRYDAVVVSVPTPLAVVELRGLDAGVALVRDAVAASPSVREAQPGDGDNRLRFNVVADRDGLTVCRDDMTQLTDTVVADAAGARRVIARLEHLARWHQIRDLANPTSVLTGQVVIEIVEARPGEIPPGPGERPPILPDDTGIFRLSYERADSGWVGPNVYVYVHNRSTRPLHCVLLDLTDRFRCHGRLSPDGPIAPGGTGVAYGGRPIPLTLPKERIAAGGTQVQDWLKLIASEQPIASGDFELPNLDGGLVTPARERFRQDPADRGSSRDLGDEEEASAPQDWTTMLLSIVTERPGDGVVVPAAGPVALAGGAVELEAHPAITGAHARLAAVAPPSRGSNVADPAPDALVQDPAVAVPIRFAGARSVTEPELDHLELRGEIDSSLVDASNPLRVRVRTAVNADDVVLAVAREGDLFIPLGVGVATAPDGAAVSIERLPDGDGDGGGGAEPGTRGLGRSIRIFFQRVIAGRLGVDPGWPRLSLAHTSRGHDGGELTVDLDADVSHVAAAVAAAERTLLVVHGVLGDTRPMLRSLHDALGERYDAILAFDYDSVGVPITETAEELAARLAAAGVAAGSGRRVDVVAVSSGALVVRWFAERLDGASVLATTVLAGVPNRGTPWAAIEGWVTSTLAIGINGLASIVWPAKALGWLVGAIERSDRGIDDLSGGSELLTDLATSSGAVPAYTVVVGDSSLRERAELDADEGRIGRLLGRLGRQAVGLAFLRQPNDLVSAVSSIRALPRAIDPSPTIVEVPCDHLTYLLHPAAVGAIVEALG